MQRQEKAHDRLPSMTAKEKITKARASLVLTSPFFASLALKMKLVEDPKCDTMWVDGISMGYNPQFIEPLPLEQVKGLICHEVMHVACNHNIRRGERNFEHWNIACDYAIDPIVKNAGFAQPWENIQPKYHNWEAEKIFNELFQSSKDEDREGAKEGAGEGIDGQDNKNNSAQTGRNGPYPCGFGEVRDYPGKNGGKASTAEKRQAEQEQKIAVRQAAQIAKSQGTLPHALERLIREITEPEIPWRELLARFLTEQARNDYSWSMPNRRFMQQGLYLPELKNPELGLIALLVDTSGSISQKELNQFATEIHAMLAAYKTELIVIYVDAAVQGSELICRDDAEINLEPKGGGGTDYRPGYDWLQKQGHLPTAAVYLTDGYCNSFPQEPNFPTLWVLTQGSVYFKPPFGEILVIDNDVHDQK
jgi:predicted metal-dependent peptidase